MSERCMACGRGGDANGLAIAGFVCSAVGLFTAGLASPVGLVLSLVALGKTPRGLAVAGVILGLLGLGCIPGLVILGLAVPVLAALGIAAAAMTPRIEAMHDMAGLQTAVLAYREHEGSLPTNLGELAPKYLVKELGETRSNEEMLIDPWKKAYSYEPALDGTKFRIMSGGPDAKFGTGDDLTVTVEVPRGMDVRSEGVEVERRAF